MDVKIVLFFELFVWFDIEIGLLLFFEGVCCRMFLEVICMLGLG